MRVSAVGGRSVKRRNATAVRTGDLAPTVQTRVAIPFLRGLMAGVWFAIAAGVACAWQRWPDWWVWVAAAFLFGAALFWFEPGRVIIWWLERRTGVDLDLDGQQGEPVDPRILLVNPRYGQQEHRRRQLQETRARFVRWAKELDVYGTAERTWVNERGMNRDQYTQWRDALMAEGWADWVSRDVYDRPNVTQGWDLTDVGRENLERVEVI